MCLRTFANALDHAISLSLQCVTQRFFNMIVILFNVLLLSVIGNIYFFNHCFIIILDYALRLVIEGKEENYGIKRFDFL